MKLRYFQGRNLRPWTHDINEDTRLQIHSSNIQNQIYTIRGERVMIDRGLAKIYGVETRALNQAVKRNSERFPSDFMFQLSDIEFQHWTSQIVMSNAIQWY